MRGSLAVGHDGEVPPSADAAALRGDLGETWVEVVAAGSGMIHSRSGTLDLEKADVALTLLGDVAGTYNPSVKVQVKTTTAPRWNGAGDLVHDLDVATYDVLRRTDHAVRRTLIVFALPADEVSVRLIDEGTLLAGRGAWVSIEGFPPTPNSATVAVTLPRSNAVDPAGLRTMLERHGTRTSTPVPIIDEWSGGGDD